MCLTNQSDVSVSLKIWQEIFPDGIPFFYENIDTNLNPSEPSLANIKKGKEKDLLAMEQSHNAEIARTISLDRRTGHFPLLGEILNNG